MSEERRKTAFESFERTFIEAGADAAAKAVEKAFAMGLSVAFARDGLLMRAHPDGSQSIVKALDPQGSGRRTPPGTAGS